MSLIKCRECDSLVSSEELKCSICGAKTSSKPFGVGKVVVVFLLVVLTIWLGKTVFSGSDSDANENQPIPITRSSTVDEPLQLKDLALGVNLAALKIKQPKTVGNTAMFDFEYFGENLKVFASTNSAGVVYKYETTFAGDLEALKKALEEKYTKVGIKIVYFSCGTDKQKSSDGSAFITTEVCQLLRGTEVLKFRKTIIESSSPGTLTLPITSVTIELVDTKLAQETKAENQASKAEWAKKVREENKKDI